MTLKPAHLSLIAATMIALAGCDQISALVNDPAKLCALPATREGLLSVALGQDAEAIKTYSFQFDAPTMEGRDASTKRTTCSANLTLVRRDGKKLPAQESERLLEDLVQYAARKGGSERRVTYAIQPSADDGQPIYSVSSQVAGYFQFAAARSSYLLDQALAKRRPMATAAAPEAPSEPEASEGDTLPTLAGEGTRSTKADMSGLLSGVRVPESYLRARPKLLALGLKPVRVLERSESGCPDYCARFPEIIDCGAFGPAACRIAFVAPDGRYVVASITGELLEEVTLDAIGWANPTDTAEIREMLTG